MATTMTVLLGHIVTMDDSLRVFQDGAVVVVGDKIHALGHKASILQQFGEQADSVVDLSGHWILPGEQGR